MTIETKLNALRNEMLRNKIDMYLVPSFDAHNNEYLPACWKRCEWISGFTGSAGEVLVCTNEAYLWTDGRYFLQATSQLDANHYTLMRQSGFTSEFEAWLATNGHGKTIGIDPKVVSINRVANLTKIMSSVGGQILFIEDNLINTSQVIMNEVIEMPSTPIIKQEDIYSGQNAQSKLISIRAEMAKSKANYLVLNMLDEIAWLFNIRGNDIQCNPLTLSYAIIGADKAWLFINTNNMPNALKLEMQELNIDLLQYDEFANKLLALNGNIILDPSKINHWIHNKLSVNTKVTLQKSPIVNAKASKNTVEQNGARMAHQKDAVAVISFLYWLEQNWKKYVDEVSAQNKLQEFRTQQINYIQDSFASISGFASNGAIIHYRSNPQTSKQIDNSSLYLIDSGGQYLEGTTDITRTVHLGEPTPQQKKHYTLVLKGHLALGRAKFPSDTYGEHIDALARQYLWSELLDYPHGTGHGVGSFLCVHEGPQKISKMITSVPITYGMILSNEPGFYIPDQYGIRIENLCLVQYAQDLNVINQFGKFLGFEDLTLVPYAKKLIDLTLLDKVEIQQIQTYYSRIKDLILPKLPQPEQDWLLNEMSI